MILWLPSGIFGFYYLSKFKLHRQILFLLITLIILFMLRVTLKIGYFDVDKIILSVFSYLFSYSVIKFTKVLKSQS